MVALTVMGLTYQNLRGKLVRALGPGGDTKVSKAETSADTAFSVFKSVKGGLQHASEVKGQQGAVGTAIQDGIKSEVTKSLVLAGIQKVVTMLVPGGGFINAIIGAFQTVQTVIQQGAQIAQVVTSALGSIGAIAAGNIGSAVGLIDRTLGGAIPVALAWLGKVVGLGNLGGKIKGIIVKVRGKLDSVVDKLVGKVKGLIDKLFGKGKDGKKPGEKPADVAKRNKELPEKEKQEKLGKAVTALKPVLLELTRNGMAHAPLKAKLNVLAKTHDLTSLTLKPTGRAAAINARVNPDLDFINLPKSDKQMIEQVIDASQDRVIRAVHKVGDSMRSGSSQSLNPFQSRGKTKKMQSTENAEGTSTKPVDPMVDLSTPRKMLDSAHVMAQGERAPHMTYDVRVAPESSGLQGTQIRDRQTYSTGVGHQHVVEGGAYRNLESEIKQHGLSARDIVVAVNCLATGDYDTLKQKNYSLGAMVKISALYKLMYGNEASRSRAAVLTLPIGIQIASSPHITDGRQDEAAMYALTKHHMAPVGAVKPHYAIENNLDPAYRRSDEYSSNRLTPNQELVRVKSVDGILKLVKSLFGQKMASGDIYYSSEAALRSAADKNLEDVLRNEAAIARGLRET